jgi:hypothetical protein
MCTKVPVESVTWMMQGSICHPQQGALVQEQKVSWAVAS